MCTEKNDIGIYGLGVMGKSIALNIASKGYKVAIFNYEDELTKKFPETKNVTPFFNLNDFISSLKDCKTVFIMVTAGEAVDSVINQLKEHLSKDDIIIDGGNSYFKDTIRRFEELKKIGIDYLGAGISGGEKGALLGPSIMISGNKKAYEKIKHIFNDIAAKAEKDNKSCCAYIGENGSGHYVKMVHNGIEYADMQIISEAYYILRNVLKLSLKEISSIFEKWNHGKLKSYLIEITSKILAKKDDLTNDNYLIDMILDKAGNKGTGKWVCIESFNLGIPIPTIIEAAYSRFLSTKKEERILASDIFKKQNNSNDVIEDYADIIDCLENAIYFAKISCYAQGFDLLKEASKIYNWNLNLSEIADIWRAGCIIRANLLHEIKEVYSNSNIINLIFSENFKDYILNYQKELRKIISYSINNGIYIPSMTSAITYFDGYSSKNMASNLIQAQRDYFGAHKYERIDRKDFFHTNWD